MNDRLKKFTAQWSDRKIDAYLVTPDINISYLTRFPAHESWLLVFPQKAFYITDFRYVLEAKQGLKGVHVHQYSQSLITGFFQLLKSHRATTVGFDEQHISLELYKKLKKECPPGLRLVAHNQIIEKMREIKEKEETSRIRSALEIHFEAYRYLKRIIKPGVTERSVVLALEQFVKSRRVGFSFDPIIASGPNSCYPHAKVTDRKIRNNEPVLADIGIDFQGYKSDLTRMFFLGKIPPLVDKVNEIVATAQKLAIKKIRPGISAAAVDHEARNYIKQKGFAQYFGHSLGHGVGLEIHEGPRISHQSSTILKTGMIFTVEPAIYIPNKFGIRIEDMVLVTQDGCEVL